MFPPSRPLGREHGSDADSAVRQTDTDAALARLSAVKKGYIEDPFILHVVPRAQSQPVRSPLINIGTYVRSRSIDALVDQWLALCENQGSPCQIVSLGAGSDTRFWRIRTGPRSRVLKAYFELDFPDVTTKKAMTIRKSRVLSHVLGSPERVTVASGGTALHSDVYHLLPCDLRLPPPTSLAPVLEGLLSPSLPTLLLCECVLVYMAPESTVALFDWFVSHLDKSALGVIVYEMFGLQDAFGQIMLNNLQSRNVSLPGAVPYATIDSLRQRFARHGFTFSYALTLDEVRKKYTSRTEIDRVSRLELLDEVEELNLVLKHYAITWGAKMPSDSTSLWNEWQLKLPTQTTIDSQTNTIFINNHSEQ